MQANLSKQLSSYLMGSSPVTLSSIVVPTTSVVVWQRPENKVVRSYFELVVSELQKGIRSVFTMSSLTAELNALLPDAIGKEQAIEDVYLLSDMLTCLFGCDEVGLRLVSMDQPMCPRFHTDNIQVRLITTYWGPGSQWLPNEDVDTSKLGHGANGMSDDQSGLYTCADAILQMYSFDVGLLKGSAWAEDHLPAIHRSCPLDAGQQRVVLTLDPL